MYDNNWKLPSQEQLSNALKNVGWTKSKVSTHSSFVPVYVGLDFGGLGKGWVIDRIVEFLISNGICRGIVDGGGDLRVWGEKVWRIGLQNPYGEGLAGVIKIKNQAVATSGDYENFFIHKTGKYHHIIDPITGYPAKSGLNSATVISDSCAVSDGLATGLFVMGKSGHNKMEHNGYKCIVISKKGRYHSRGLEIEWFDYDKK
jgi:thiamine biosynthesis lipoprotein